MPAPMPWPVIARGPAPRRLGILDTTPEPFGDAIPRLRPVGEPPIMNDRLPLDLPCITS